VSSRTFCSVVHRQRRELFDRGDLASLDRRQQQLDPAGAGLAQRLAHGGQPDHGRLLDVVEADHGQVLGHA
jgi:hypothetical protein